ncbi:MAG: acyl-CoA dehydrogenase family protein [Rhodocyclaceae bacterium]|nr:acyl-CoA dehydrogenase family protein [Rhodocyclaceae bacterium]
MSNSFASVSNRAHATPLKLTELDFSLSARGAQVRDQLAAFLDECVMPQEQALSAQMDALNWSEPFAPLMLELRAEARQRGLWNLFLADPVHGAGLSNVDYGHVCELIGRSPWAPMVFTAITLTRAIWSCCSITPRPNNEPSYLTRCSQVIFVAVSR